MKTAASLLPAALAGALMLDLIDGVGGAVVAAFVLLIAPGFLLWKSLVGGFGHSDAAALPALWLVASFTLLSPVVGGMVFFGWSVAVIEWYALVGLIVLGVSAACVPAPRVAPVDTYGRALAAVAGAAAVYRMITWHGSGDDVSYLGFARWVVEFGSFPDSNPFLSGDLPLASRWNLDGWTGLTGTIAHLGNSGAATVYRDVLPPLLVVVAASALFVLVRTLTSDSRFAHIAALAGLTVPLLTEVRGKTDYVYWYGLIAQNKYTALTIFLPVVASLLIAAHRSRKRSSMLVAAVALWAMMFVHPLPAVLVVAVFGTFGAIDLVVNRRREAWAAVGAAVLMVLPMGLTATAISATAEPFGSQLGDVENLSDIAYPRLSVGPIEIWEPYPSKGRPIPADPSNQNEVTAILVAGHSVFGGEPRIAFVSNGLPLAHWEMLANPGNLMVLLAAGVIIIGRHRDQVALWLLAAALTAVSVFVLPPLAALIARLITPWQLWRFATLMPVPLATAWLVARWLPKTERKALGAAAIVAILVATAVFSSHDRLLERPPELDRTALLTETLDGGRGDSPGNGVDGQRGQFDPQRDRHGRLQRPSDDVECLPGGAEHRGLRADPRRAPLAQRGRDCRRATRDPRQVRRRPASGARQGPEHRRARIAGLCVVPGGRQRRPVRAVGAGQSVKPA